MYNLFSAAIKAAKGAQPLHESENMNSGRWTENKYQNSKYHQFSLPLCSPVLDSAQPETWAGKGWNKEIWRSTKHPTPALPHPGRKRRKGGMRTYSKWNKRPMRWVLDRITKPKYMPVELSNLNLREKYLSKMKAWKSTEWYQEVWVSCQWDSRKKEEATIARLNDRKLPKVCKGHKPTYSQSSANPIQSEDSAHSWTSWSKLS